jgi:hypothetical protein
MIEKNPEATAPRVVNPRTKETDGSLRLEEHERLRQDEYDDSPGRALPASFYGSLRWLLVQNQLQVLDGALGLGLLHGIANGIRG